MPNFHVRYLAEDLKLMEPGSVGVRWGSMVARIGDRFIVGAESLNLESASVDAAEAAETLINQHLERTANDGR